MVVRVKKPLAVNLQHSTRGLVSQTFCPAQAVDEVCMTRVHSGKQFSLYDIFEIGLGVAGMKASRRALLNSLQGGLQLSCQPCTHTSLPA